MLSHYVCDLPDPRACEKVDGASGHCCQVGGAVPVPGVLEEKGGDDHTIISSSPEENLIL